MADPVNTYPALFKGNKFFTRFPYALPNLVTASLLVGSVITGWLFIDETLSVKKNYQDTGLRVKNWLARQCCCGTGPRRHIKGHYRLPSGNTMSEDVEQALLDNVRPSSSGSEAIIAMGNQAQKDHPAPASAAAPPLKELFTRQVTLNIIAYSLLSAHTTSFDQIFPMFLATSIKDGGLGLEPATIGVCLSIIGAVAMVAQIVIFPPVQRKLGSAWCLRASTVFYCGVYLGVPFLQKLAGRDIKTVCGGVLLILFGKVLAGVFAFPASAILVTNAVPSARLLGSVNGLNQAIGSFMRMLGPAVFGFILSYSLESKMIALVWICLSALSAVGCLIACLLTEDWRRPDLADMDEGITLGDYAGRLSHQL